MSLEQKTETVEKGDPLKDIFFEPDPFEKVIDTDNGNRFQFTIKGLSAFELEEVSGNISREVKLDTLTKEPIIHLDPGQYNFQLVFRGVTRAACNGEPIPWTEENVKRLQEWIRNELLEEIKQRSDGLATFKKS